MPHSLWKGHLKLSLVSVPVRAYTAAAAASDGGDIHLNQLHDKCHSRIQYVKTCPIHGKIPNSEIASGYEFSKGQYVVVEPEELDKLRSESDRAVDIQAFVGTDAIDPVYYSGKTYYLVPDGAVGQKPYTLIRRAMEDRELVGIAQVVITSREQLVLVRPLGRLIAMEVLNHAAEIKPPSDFEAEVDESEVTSAELKLTETLMNAFLQEAADLKDYPDVYTEKLTALIRAKVNHQELVAPPATEEPRIINLMDALKQSLARAKGGHAATKKSEPSAKDEHRATKRKGTVHSPKGPQKPTRRKKTG